MASIRSARRAGPAALSIICALTLSSAAAFAEPAHGSGWALKAAPAFVLPISSGDFGANELFASAWGAELNAEYTLGMPFPLAIRLGMAYSSGGLLPIEGVAVEGVLSEAVAMAGASAGLQLARRLTAFGFADGGAAYGAIGSGDPAVYGVARAGAGLELGIGDSMLARADASWMYKFGLYGGLGLSLGVGYRLPAGRAGALKALEIASVELDQVFPVFRSSYDDRPLGKARITNKGAKAATDVRVSLFLKQYMDAPKECATIARIEPGKSVDVDLFGLFNDGILAVTESTKAIAELRVEYAGGAPASRSTTATVLDRNALTWKDDRAAAAFVSAKDPWVLDLSGNFMAAARAERNPGLPERLQTAMAFHEGLKVYGVAYVPSPNRPFAQATVDAAAVDSLKFPRQTLGYRAGDCADLSVLYASMLEAVGIETAFVTVPGHIFVAFDSGMTQDEARSRLIDEKELIASGGRLWIPIETTMRNSGFVDAWRQASAQWREASSRNKAGFLPTHASWAEYPPVGLPADGSTVAAPAQAALASAFRAELAKAVAAELDRRLAALGPQPAKGAAAYLNGRGILYARYDRLAEAERDFKAAAKEQYQPAIVNLGNVAFLKADYAGAYALFGQAAKASPGNPKLLVSMARAASALGKAKDVAALMDQVKQISPETAERYASIVADASSATRAASVGTAEVIWF